MILNRKKLKIMKRRINIIYVISLTAILSIAGCSEDILEKPTPPGQQTDVTYYKTATGLSYFLNQCYQSLGNYIMTNYTQSLVTIGSLASDDAWAGGENYSDGPDRHNISDYRIFADNSIVIMFWKHLYQCIRYCNIVIDNSSFTEENDPNNIETIRDYVAQAKTLRAYCYFTLVRSFGGVPLSLRGSSLDILPRSSAREVYDQVITDLDEAISSGYLIRHDELSTELKGRITNGAAKALKAKVYLYLAAFEPAKAQEHYSTAYNMAKEVINSGEFSLIPDYSQLWGYDDLFGTESIFEIGYPHPDDNLGTHHWWATWLRPRYIYAVGTRDKIGIEGNAGWGFNTPTQDFVDAFEEGDPRLHWTVWFQGDTTKGLSTDGLYHEICFANSETGYYYRKTTPEEFYAKMDAAMGFKIYRYADLLLVGAEAANEIGNTGDALTWINKVRERARNTPAPFGYESEKIEGVPADVTITDKAQLRDIIRHERRVEMGCEGQRAFDLKRYHGMHGYNMKEIIEKAYLVQGPDYLITNNDPKSGQPRETREIDIDLSKHLLLPIPKSEIEATNGVLDQNPGY